MQIIITGNKNDGDWPRASCGLCHWCCHGFDSVPVLLPVWSRTHYHLSGNYCCFNCAKSDAILKTKTHVFPKALTSLGLFAAKIATYRGSVFAGITPAAPKETLQAFGGTTTITQFRRGAMIIEKYEYIERLWRPRELLSERGIDPQFLYTFKPLRRVQLLDCDEEDPVGLIQRRVW